MPLTGIENARPATKAASKPRVNKDDLLFDPNEFLKFELPYNPAMENWGSGNN